MCVMFLFPLTLPLKLTSVSALPQPSDSSIKYYSNCHNHVLELLQGKTVHMHMLYCNVRSNKITCVILYCSPYSKWLHRGVYYSHKTPHTGLY